MTTFRKAGPNLIESDEGSIRTTGRAGVDVSYLGEHIRISSEMLYTPMGIALFVSGGDRTSSPRAEEVIDYTVAGLTWAGFTVQVQ